MLYILFFYQLIFFSQSEHSNLFPSKGSLQLKIREVRQKLMAKNTLTPASANTVESPKDPNVTCGKNYNYQKL